MHTTGLKKVCSFILLVAATMFAPSHALAEEDFSGQENPSGNSFTFHFGTNADSMSFYSKPVNAGACTGTFADTRLEHGRIIGYGISVTCYGTGFLPLDVQIELQEEHLGFRYQTVDQEFRRLHDGYGFVRGEAICGDDRAGHDYRVKASIKAGEHWGGGLSREVHLPCNVH